MAAAPEKTFKIIDLAKVPSAEAGRVGKYDVIVTYQDSAGRVRVITVPAEDFTGKSEEDQLTLLRQRITAEEGERLKFVGKEITI